MNLEQLNNQKKAPQVMDDFEIYFKPITSGLGFHHQKTTEAKSVITERTVAVSPIQQAAIPKKEATVYQNDLSMFYGQAVAEPELAPLPKMEAEVYYKTASGTERVFAYITDLLLISSILGIVMTVIARTISMDLMEVWSQYPNEITPLVMTLFCGFYILYFSVFEKMQNSTLGKSLFKLSVVGLNNKPLSLVSLVIRTTISLLNFVSLGLFSYFDLQNKVTSAKVIRTK